MAAHEHVQPRMKRLLAFIALFAGLVAATVAPQEVRSTSDPRSWIALQVMALKDFYKTTNGPQWTLSTNWLQGDPCDNNWYVQVIGHWSARSQVRHQV